MLFLFVALVSRRTFSVSNRKQTKAKKPYFHELLDFAAALWSSDLYTAEINVTAASTSKECLSAFSCKYPRVFSTQ